MDRLNGGRNGEPVPRAWHRTQAPCAKPAKKLRPGLAVGLAVALMAGCGGGGGSPSTATSAAPVAATPAPTATLSLLGIGGQSPAFAQAVSLPPTFTGTMTLGIGTGSTNPTVRVDVTVTGCAGAQNFAAVVTLRSDIGSFSATPSQTFANSQTCQYTLTPSVNGVVGTPVSGSFTTEAAAQVHYDALLFITADGQPGQTVVKDGKMVDVLFVNKTSYGAFGSCAIVYSADGNALKSKSGLPVTGCVVSDYSLHNFEMNPVTGEISKEVGAIPADAVYHNAGYGTFGDTPYAANEVGFKGMFAVTSGGVHYRNSQTALNHWFAPAGDFTKATLIGTIGYSHFVAVSN